MRRIGEARTTADDTIEVGTLEHALVTEGVEAGESGAQFSRLQEETRVAGMSQLVLGLVECLVGENPTWSERCLDRGEEGAFEIAHHDDQIGLQVVEDAWKLQISLQRRYHNSMAGSEVACAREGVRKDVDRGHVEARESEKHGVSSRPTSEIESPFAGKLMGVSLHYELDDASRLPKPGPRGKPGFGRQVLAPGFTREVLEHRPLSLPQGVNERSDKRFGLAHDDERAGARRQQVGIVDQIRRQEVDSPYGSVAPIGGSGAEIDHRERWH